MTMGNTGAVKNKVAVITGGSRGLGRNTAFHLARRGVDVIFTYRSNQKEAESLIGEIETMGRNAAAFRFDTGDTSLLNEFVADVRKTLQKWGRERFDYLVNNAGILCMLTSTKRRKPSSMGSSTFMSKVFTSLRKSCCRSSTTAAAS
jgi:NAD(P)-dependent dehydrogenase (short-subunit alcohol dehydrogenase family)